MDGHGARDVNVPSSAENGEMGDGEFTQVRAALERSGDANQPVYASGL